MEGAGIIPSQEMFMKRVVKINTTNLFVQKKFNLLKEENEGYAKLIAELGLVRDIGSVGVVIMNIRALIGKFSLDPNRCIDMILESYESNPHIRAYSFILKEFKPRFISDILGFKFQYYHRSEAPATPESLYILTAVLVGNESISLDSILPHLSPSLDDFAVEMKKKEEKVKADAMGLNSISLVSQNTTDPKKTSEMDTEEVAGEFKKNLDQQHFGVINALIKLGAWSLVLKYFNICSAAGVIATTDETIAKSLCGLVRKLIYPIYATMPPLSLELNGETYISSTVSDMPPNAVDNVITPSQKLEDWIVKVHPMLAALGSSVHHDIKLFTYLCRLIKDMIPNEKSPPSEAQSMWSDKKCKNMAINIVAKNLLPSLTLLPSNPPASHELWSVMKLMEWELRYKLYTQMVDEAYEANAALMYTHANAVKNTKYTMKRIAKENVKEMGRMLAKFAHANPLVVLELVCAGLESYDNLIDPLIDSFKTMTQLSMDILAYCIVRRLSLDRETSTEAGDLSRWFQAIAKFVGKLYRKYPDIELGGLLRFIAERLKVMC
jgi:THO complex subunit 2